MKGTETMFEIIVEENCTNRECFISIAKELDKFIKNIVSSQNLDSLRYIVVADSNIENYRKSVEKYAKILGKDVYVTNDGSYNVAGKSIEGFSESGEYIQAIIIKSALVLGMYADLLTKEEVSKQFSAEYETLKNVGLATVIHEIGHAVDNANVYKIRGYLNEKIYYNLAVELEEYIVNTAYSIWGEYFAETYSYRVLSTMELSTPSKEEELISCMKFFSKEKNINAVVERIYRILYWFVQCIAYSHIQKLMCFDYEKYSEDEIVSAYVPFLARTEITIVNMLSEYPQWDVDICMDELVQIIKDMIEFEKKI